MVEMRGDRKSVSLPVVEPANLLCSVLSNASVIHPFFFPDLATESDYILLSDREVIFLVETLPPTRGLRSGCTRCIHQ